MDLLNFVVNFGKSLYIFSGLLAFILIIISFSKKKKKKKRFPLFFKLDLAKNEPFSLGCPDLFPKNYDVENKPKIL